MKKGMWFYVLVSFLIVFMHFWSTQSAITPEPGASVIVYEQYNAQIRIGGIESVGFEAPPEFQETVAKWVKEIEEKKKSCSQLLKDKEKTCQASDNIEASAQLKHWKSYLLPSLVAGLSFSGKNVEEIEKFVATGTNYRAPSTDLYSALRRSALFFFNFLLIVKLLIWSLLWFSLRSKVSAFYFGAMFIGLSLWGLLLDIVLKRGAGVYAVDNLVAGTSSFNIENSKISAIAMAFVGIYKAVIAPVASASIFGIAPRSTAIFIAAAIVIPIVTTGTWKFFWLVPIGLAIHFTTFLPLLGVGSLIALIVIPQLNKSVILTLGGATLLSLPIVYIQFVSGDPVQPLFSYWVVLGVVTSVSSFAIWRIFHREELATIKVQAFRIGITSLVAFTAVSSWTIWKLSLRYGQTDTQGFWEDGLLRELSGRLAPLMTILILCVPMITGARVFLPRINPLVASWETDHFSWDSARQFTRGRTLSVISVAALLTVSIFTSGVFLP